MTIDAEGRMTSFRFTRAIVQIAEVIAYEEAQRRIDAGEAEAHLVNLWGAWKALATARQNRDPLELDCPNGAWFWMKWGAWRRLPCVNDWTRIAWSKIS
jgi:exoribonuclease R